MAHSGTRPPSWLSIVAVATLLVLSVTTPAFAAGSTTETDSSLPADMGSNGPPAFALSATESCSNVVTHDAFRYDNETVQAAANGSATSLAQNTEATIEQNSGFIRIKAENPNAYCVKFQVEINETIVSPAEIGPVTSVDGNVTAEWHAIRDFDAGETYTQVTFTLPGASTATFAPSKIRIESLAWTGKAEKAKGWIDELTDVDLFGDDDALTKNTYTFSVENNSSATQQIVTVPLKNSTTDKSISEWHASYKADAGYWQPISKDADAPVFMRRLDDNRLQFIFNDANATVKFVANPGPIDKLDYQLESYRAGLEKIQQQLLEMIG